jgi:hypothetical protein
MKLNPPLLAMKANIEVGRQTCHCSIGKFDSSDGEIGRRNVEGNSFSNFSPLYVRRDLRVCTTLSML